MKIQGRKLFTTEDIIYICKLKHYQTGAEGLINFIRLKEILKEKGMHDTDIQICLHP